MRGRPATPIGLNGRIRKAQLPSGTWQASTNVRDFDGKLRRVKASGATATKAENALKRKLQDRDSLGTTELSPDSKLTVLADEWYADKLTEGLAYRTTQRYKEVLDLHVLPGIGQLRIREATTGRLGRFLRSVATNTGAATAILCKTVLSGMMTLAAAHDTITTNPTVGITIKKPDAAPIRALSVTEFHEMRQLAQVRLAPMTEEERLAKTGDRARMGGRNRSTLWLDLIDAMIATGCRPGEAVALSPNDLSMGIETPTVRVHRTIIRKTGEGLYIQEHTKARDDRLLALPQFGIDLFNRILEDREPTPHDLVFLSTAGTPIDPRNLVTAWDKTFAGTKFAWVTPKVLRKTVATLINEEASSENAAQQLGHTSDKMTKAHYIEKKRTAVDNREILQAFKSPT